ncbi:MAG: hypothetical protein ACFBZ8_02695 [Opitutales bacterium]
MRNFNSKNYPEGLRPLLERDVPSPLGPGKPDPAKIKQIDAAKVVEQLMEAGAREEAMCQACLSGIYLLHDALDRSHDLSQAITGPTGSFWHGIMHRREPDYPNAKYWFAKVGEHPVFPVLHTESSRLSEEQPSSARTLFLFNQDHWNADAFIDFAEAVHGSASADEKLAQAIQQREWELLFDYSFQAAMGASVE